MISLMWILVGEIKQTNKKHILSLACKTPRQDLHLLGTHCVQLLRSMSVIQRSSTEFAKHPCLIPSSYHNRIDWLVSSFILWREKNQGA
jgi:hypothetical protein